jgi:excisionase family DNA binding protein
MSISEGADYHGVSTRTIRRWIATGRLPAYRVGDKLLRIDPADLDRISRRVPAAGGSGDGRDAA